MDLLGQRVKLRLMKEKDAEALYCIVQESPQLWTYMVRKLESFEDMKKIVAEAIEDYKKGKALPFIVIDQKTNKIVGSTRLYDISFNHRTLELGSTFYSPSVQRTGINTECKYLLLQHAFEKLEMIRVQIKTDEQNKRAQKAIERLGAKKEGVLRNERTLPNGRIRDAVIYSIIKEEWPLIKGKLEIYLDE